MHWGHCLSEHVCKIYLEALRLTALPLEDAPVHIEIARCAASVPFLVSLGRE